MGWLSSIQFFLDFLNFFNFAKPLTRTNVSLLSLNQVAETPFEIFFLDRIAMKVQSYSANEWTL